MANKTCFVINLDFMGDAMANIITIKHQKIGQTNFLLFNEAQANSKWSFIGRTKALKTHIQTMNQSL